MRLTILRPLPASAGVIILLALAMPAYASGRARIAARDSAASSTAQRIGLYSPRVRRSTVMYLRLRLLELREAGLDRARAAIERRLSIDELLAEPASRQPTDIVDKPPRPRTPPAH